MEEKANKSKILKELSLEWALDETTQLCNIIGKSVVTAKTQK